MVGCGAANVSAVEKNIFHPVSYDVYSLAAVVAEIRAIGYRNRRNLVLGLASARDVDISNGRQATPITLGAALAFVIVGATILRIFLLTWDRDHRLRIRLIG